MDSQFPFFRLESNWFTF